jgi:hypothetical protein
MTRIGATNPNSVKALASHPNRIVPVLRVSLGSCTGLCDDSDYGMIMTRHNVLDLFSEDR